MHNKTLDFIKAKLEEGGKGSLEIYGDISDVKFWEEDVTPLEIKENLKTLKIAQRLTFISTVMAVRFLQVLQ